MPDSLLEIIAETLEIGVNKVKEDSTIGNLPNWDSLTHIKLVLKLESRFSVRFKAEEIPELTSVKKIRQSLEKHQAEGKTG